MARRDQSDLEGAKSEEVDRRRVHAHGECPERHHRHGRVERGARRSVRVSA